MSKSKYLKTAIVEEAGGKVTDISVR